MDRRRYLQLLEQILDDIVASVDEAVQAGETLSDDLQNMLADEIDATIAEIRQLQDEISQEENPPEAGPTQPPADAQLLWILAGQQEQAFLSYLRTYPSAATNELLRNPTLLSHTIDQLTQMMPPGEPPVVDGIQHADLNSSNIWGSAYDPRSKKMRVRFQGGSEYEYDGIPPNIYRAFAAGNAEARTSGKNRYGRWWPHKNPSLGAALNQYIKAGNFKYRRLR